MRSTTFTHLTASVQGLPVIRAFDLEDSFTNESDERMDQHAMAWFLYFSSERFFSLFLNNLVGLFIFCVMVTLLVLPDYGRYNQYPGFTDKLSNSIADS